LNERIMIMPNKKPPLVSPAKMEDERLIKELPFYPHRAFDVISIRNFAIRVIYMGYKRLEDYGIKVPYNTKIKILQDWFFTSPQNIERIITDNTDK
tara:strand:+ start:6388 stop:6675 length:288 start_codon:yes stop_codon:yes gene_type:complete